MEKKILVATPDTKWANEISASIISSSFECKIVESGKECQLQIYKGNFNHVIVDICLSNHSGIEVLKYLKLNHPPIKVILVYPECAGNADPEFKKNLSRTGVAKIFERPFPHKILLDFLKEASPADHWKKISATSEIDTVVDLKIRDSDCTRIEIESFYAGNMAIFDYFIRIKADHYVKIVSLGQTIDPERIRKFIQDGVKYVYFLTKERTSYINFMNEMAKTALSSSQIKPQEFVTQLKNVSEQLVEEIYTRGLRPDLIEESKAISNNIFGLMKSNAALDEILSEYNQMNPAKFSHLFLVSFFATLICKNLDWVGNKTREVITLGAFLHDIGHLKLPATLRDKSVRDMDPKELALYQQHPGFGADMLSLVTDINPQVIQIVYQHHETITGTGYPNALSGTKIYPLAKIVSLADEFASLLMEEKVTPLEGLKLLLKDRERVMKFDSSAIKSLVQGFVQVKPT